jgi:hypothetical protein
MIIVEYEEDIDKLEKKKAQEKSRTPRTRNPLTQNLFWNKFE